MTELVRARRFGKKWALRACGHALFHATEEQWETGDVPGFTEDWGWMQYLQRPEYQGARQNRLNLAHRAVENRQAVRRAWARMKVVGGDIPNSQELLAEDVVFVCNLAESKGYHSVVRSLESLCLRVSQEIQGEDFWRRFLEKRALPISDRHCIYDYKYGFIINDRHDDRKFPAAWIDIELISAAWLASFLSDLDLTSEMDGADMASRLDDLVEGFLLEDSLMS